MKLFVTSHRPTFRLGGTVKDAKLKHGDIVEATKDAPDSEGDWRVRDANGEIRFIQDAHVVPLGDWKVGDKVIVPTDAKRTDGVDPVYFGKEVVATIIAGPDSDGDWEVRTEDRAAENTEQYVGGQYLRKYVEPTPAPTQTASVDDFKPGDKVRVSSAAKTSEGHGVYFGITTEGTVEHLTNKDVAVLAPNREAMMLSQFVAPQFLTKLADAPAEEEATPPAPVETEDDAAPATVTIAALRKAWALLDFDRLVAIVEGNGRAADDALLALHLDVAKAIEEGV
ncbi:hypothetical protein SEA_EMOTION_43 [Arthrobacter phage Emotion]|uniref:Uncharacterized protein n=1 Tax=Arthrobacter phage Emotion TaxID=3038361 RepID=A0AA49ERX4_9CAUD|nr:hypothetical protein SEA_EMOTION_43 [Arthrobacter phage Emotion]